MNTYQIIAPERLDATVNLPASKSISNRALVIHALAGERIVPDNLSDCDDTEVLVAALAHLPHTIDIKAAGTAMRFITAYLAVAGAGEYVVTGTERMRHRPIGALVEALRMMGADIGYVEQEGFPPLRIQGHRLLGGRLEVPGNISSQYISALLLIGPVMERGLELHLTGTIVSRPYIDLTLWMMREFGANADWTGCDTISVRPQPYKARHYLIENDWSAASYWYEMTALYGIDEARVKLKGLMDGSKQGDSVVKYLFSLLGVKTTFEDASSGEPTTVTLTRHLARVQHLDFDFINCPDLAQTAVTTCCALDIPFHFKGLASLKIKETDRLEALITELRKLGFVLRSLHDSELVWDGSRCTPSFEAVDTYEDHRMALAFAPLAIKFPRLRINTPEVVSKSYPRFWDDLRQGAFLVQD
jgi:3-phosphoshikimate 1-carboxyvinyltransferase